MTTQSPTRAPNDFAAVSPNSLSEQRTSPRLPDDVSEAIAISGPASVLFGERVMVSGTIRFHMGRFGRTDHAAMVNLVVVGPRGQSFVMPSWDVDGDVDRPVRTPEPLSEVLVEGWFNTEIRVPGAPLSPGDWTVHACAGPYRSNGVTIRILPLHEAR